MWVQIALNEEAIFMGKHMPRHAQRHSAVSFAKMAEPTEMPFGLWTRVGPRKHGANWWIPLNRPCAAAMRPFCQMTLTTCYYNVPSVWWSRRPMERCRLSSRWQTSAGRSWDHRSLSHESASADLSTAQSQASFNRLTSVPKHLWLCKVSMQRSLMLSVSIISPLLIIITITIMLFKAS